MLFGACTHSGVALLPKALTGQISLPRVSLVLGGAVALQREAGQLASRQHLSIEVGHRVNEKNQRADGNRHI